MSAPIGPLATGAADLGGMAETDRVARTARAAGLRDHSLSKTVVVVGGTNGSADRGTCAR